MNALLGHHQFSQALHQAQEHGRRATEKKGAGNYTVSHEPRQLLPVQMPRFVLPVLPRFTQDMRLFVEVGSAAHTFPQNSVRLLLWGLGILKRRST